MRAWRTVLLVTGWQRDTQEEADDPWPMATAATLREIAEGKV